ncbi:FAD-dependent oxidoreductase [Kitasatospora purpeofusca]|uniref:FAD-dependent oxidoreductase n=1 Tax=Kitasatospora TaxID=2063 RepID=UPI0004BF80FF|nr:MULTISPECIES: tryptophan 7-halogenase [Kitasatospora]
MTRTLIIGGSVAGLVAALAFADLGHDVTVLERDANEAPDTVDDAHGDWQRPTVPQLHHSHAFGSLGTNLLRERLPSVYQALVAAGVREIELGKAMPPTLADKTPHPADAELRMLGSRRTTFELVLRQEALRKPGISLRRGETVRGLTVADRGPARVTGVVTKDGRTIAADLVIDASGRRSQGHEWLREHGLAEPELVAQSADITYYTRYYRAHGPRPVGPLNRGFGAGGLWDHYTGVMFLGDNNTFAISFGILPDDTELKQMRAEDVFTAVVRATPLLAPWVSPEASDPISPVHAMAGLDNSLKLYGQDAQPVPGFLPVADAVCTTNPAFGRGVSLAIAHVLGLADLVREHPEPDAEQAALAAGLAGRTFRPWFEDAVRNDAGRARLWRATVAGQQLPPLPPDVLTFGTVAEAAGTDEVVWRRLVRTMMSLDNPAGLYEDEEIRLRVKQAVAGGPPPFPAPDRATLVDIVRRAAN